MVKTKRQAKSWTEEYKDFDEKKKKVKGENEKEVEKHFVVCRYCDYEVDLDVKPFDRINQHIKGKKHQNNKERKENEKQMTLPKLIQQSQLKQKKTEDFAHDLVRAYAFSATPLLRADGFLGKVNKKYFSEAKATPTRRTWE